MKILFDHQIFNYQNFGGISRYFSEIIKGLKEKTSVEVDLQLQYAHNEHLIENKLNPTQPFLRNLKGGWRLQNLLVRLNKYLVNRKLAKGVDIFHPTYYDTYYLPYLGKAKLVLTVYDMIHEKGMFPSNLDTIVAETVENKKKLVKHASKIVAISESTKKDMVDFYGISPDKIDVIYLSASLMPNKNYTPTILIPKKYILFVGNRGSYKNFDLFFKSLIPLLKEDNTLSIVSAGSKPFTEKELNHFKSVGLSEQVIHLSIDDNLLAHLYKNAVCFVFPSLYEGFGIPTLEAFNCGCPVVLSNTSSMPEVGGDAVLYIDPHNQESIYSAVKQVVESKELQLSLREKGFQQAQKFSWGKCVEDHYKLYENLTSTSQ